MTELPADLKSKLRSVEELPTLPSVASRLLSMVRDPETTAEDVHQVITQDPSLTANVLKLVNSAFYGFSREISTVREAVVILGFNTVKSLALSVSVFDVFPEEQSPLMDRRGLWVHSIATGVAGEVIAESADVDAEEILVAGVLHDVGKIVMDLYFEDEFVSILDYSKENNVKFIEASREVVGVDHAEIGAWLIEEWKLPEPIVHGVRHFPAPREAEESRQLAILIALGNTLARIRGIGWTGDDFVPDFREDLWFELDLGSDDLDRILNRYDDEVDRAQEFMQLSKMAEEN